MIFQVAEEIRTEVIEAFRKAFGADIRTEEPAIIANLISAVAYFRQLNLEDLQNAKSSLSLDEATGAELDEIAAQSGINRIPRVAPAAEITVRTGNLPIILPEGTAFLSKVDSSVWRLQEELSLSANDTKKALVFNETNIAQAAAGDINALQTPTAGITSITNNAPSTLGKEQEGDNALRNRLRLAPLTINGTVNALTSQILSVENVVNCRVFPPNAVEDAGKINICVYGGNDTDVANAIYNNLAAGILTQNTLGGGTNASIDVKDGTTTTTIKFTKAEIVQVNFEFRIRFIGETVDDAEEVLKLSIESLIAGEFVVNGKARNGVPIGGTLYASELNYVVSMIGDAVAEKILFDSTQTPTNTADFLLQNYQVLSVRNVKIVAV